VINSHQTVAEKGGGKEHANMIIDSEGLVLPGGEAFKRKLSEGTMPGEMEKVRVVESMVQGSEGASHRVEVAVQPRQGQ